MTLERTETKNMNGVGRDFVTYRCPKSSCPTGTITLQCNTDFLNPYSQMRSCYGRGKEEILKSIYRETDCIPLRIVTCSVEKD